MGSDIEEIDEMVVEDTGSGSHYKEHNQDIRELSIPAAEGADDGMIDASNCKQNDVNTIKEVLLVPEKKILMVKKVVKKVLRKRRPVKGKSVAINEEESQSSEMFEPSVEVPTKQNVKSKENVQNNGAAGASGEGFNEISAVSEEDIRAETVMGDSSNQDTSEAKDLEPPTDTVPLNLKEKILIEATDTKNEVLRVSQKVLQPKKVLRKRRLVKGKFSAKIENEPKSLEMFEPSVEVSINQNMKSKEDVQHNGAAFTSDEGVKEIFTVLKENIREGTVMGDLSNQDTRDVKVLESPIDADILNSKEKIINDDTDTKNEVLPVSEKKVLQPKKVVRKVVKKRKLVKGKVIAKDGVEVQFSEMHEPSEDVQTNQNLKNDEYPDAKSIDNVNSSTAGRSMKKIPHQITDKVVVKFKQSENNKKVGKEKAASESENADKVEASEKHKSSDEQEIVGMVFMCSSKTKEDCYRYNVFGLPATKKESVLKIYDGMKLFLYDFRQKLLYGIYKAAGPGGYMIEPKAFHANYPSQVRFSIENDCSPLPEARFKTVIADNYFTKSKFKAELNSKQVKSLCELFLVNEKGTMSVVKRVTESPTVGIHPTVEREKKKGMVSQANTVAESQKVGIRPTVEQDKKRKARTDDEVGSEIDIKGKRVVDDAKGKDNKVIRPTAKGDARRPRVESDARQLRRKNDGRYSLANDAKSSRANEDARRSRANEDARRLRANEDARRLRANEDARRLRANEDARRLRANEDTRRLRANEDARRLRARDEERHLRREDEESRVRLDGASRLQLEDDARRIRAENEARRSRADDDARFLRAEDDARRLQVEEDVRRSLAEDRVHSPYTLSSRYSRLAEAYERETYLPTALPAPLQLGAVPPPTYTLSNPYGRTSVLDNYRPGGHEDLGLGSRPLYEHQRTDPYLAYGGGHIYSSIDPRDEYLPSTSRYYGVSPYRRY